MTSKFTLRQRVAPDHADPAQAMRASETRVAEAIVDHPMRRAVAGPRAVMFVAVDLRAETTSGGTTSVKPGTVGGRRNQHRTEGEKNKMLSE